MFDQIDARLAHIERDMVTPRHIRMTIAFSMISMTAATALVLWMVL